MNVISMTSSAFAPSLPSSLEEVGRMKSGYLVVNAKARMMGWTTTHALASSASDIHGFVREHHAQMDLRTLQTIKLYAEEALRYREASSWGEMLRNVIAKVVRLVSYLRGRPTDQEVYHNIFCLMDAKIRIKKHEFQNKTQIKFNILFEKKFNFYFEALNKEYAQLKARKAALPAHSSDLQKIEKQEARLHRKMTRIRRIFLVPDEGDPVPVKIGKGFLRRKYPEAVS